MTQGHVQRACQTTASVLERWVSDGLWDRGAAATKSSLGLSQLHAPPSPEAGFALRAAGSGSQAVVGQFV